MIIMENPLIKIDPIVVDWTWWGAWSSIWNAFWSFRNQVTSRDFSLLKWVLIWLAILIPIVLIYLFMSWKICLFNTWFWEGYWLRLVTWSFWSWKTKNVFQSAYLRKKMNPNWILISNLNYDFVDFHFDSKRDFDFILRDLVQYIRDTNNEEELKKSIDFPPIKIIVDEAHLYLFARDFKWFTKDILLVLTQCRKRDISIDFITQELWQIDVFIRRLCPYIEYFEKMPLWLTRQSILYSLDVEGTSMKNEEMFEEIESSLLLPFSRWPVFDKRVKHYYEQKFLTKYVIWWVDVWATDEDKDDIVSKKYPEFKEKMLNNLKEYRTPKSKELSAVEKLLKKMGPKSHVNDAILKKQNEIILSLLKYVPEDELAKYSELLPKQKDPVQTPEIN